MKTLPWELDMNLVRILLSQIELGFSRDHIPVPIQLHAASHPLFFPETDFQALSTIDRALAFLQMNHPAVRLPVIRHRQPWIGHMSSPSMTRLTI